MILDKIKGASEELAPKIDEDKHFDLDLIEPIPVEQEDNLLADIEANEKEANTLVSEIGYANRLYGEMLNSRTKDALVDFDKRMTLVAKSVGTEWNYIGAESFSADNSEDHFELASESFIDTILKVAKKVIDFIVGLIKGIVRFIANALRGFRGSTSKPSERARDTNKSTKGGVSSNKEIVVNVPSKLLKYFAYNSKGKLIIPKSADELFNTIENLFKLTDNYILPIISAKADMLKGLSASLGEYNFHTEVIVKGLNNFRGQSITHLHESVIKAFGDDIFKDFREKNADEITGKFNAASDTWRGDYLTEIVVESFRDSSARWSQKEKYPPWINDSTCLLSVRPGINLTEAAAKLIEKCDSLYFAEMAATNTILNLLSKLNRQLEDFKNTKAILDAIRKEVKKFVANNARMFNKHPSKDQIEAEVVKIYSELIKVISNLVSKSSSDLIGKFSINTKTFLNTAFLGTDKTKPAFQEIIDLIDEAIKDSNQGS